jgi:hypothetical protein
MMNDILSRVLRTGLQLLAGGAFAAFFTAVTGYVGSEHQALLTAMFALLVSFAQNVLEGSGKIPMLLGKEPTAPSRML